MKNTFLMAVAISMLTSCGMGSRHEVHSRVHHVDGNSPMKHLPVQTELRPKTAINIKPGEDHIVLSSSGTQSATHYVRLSFVPSLDKDRILDSSSVLRVLGGQKVEYPDVSKAPTVFEAANLYLSTPKGTVFRLVGLAVQYASDSGRILGATRELTVDELREYFTITLPAPSVIE